MDARDAQGGHRAPAPGRRLNRTIGGVMLMLAGVALMAWGRTTGALTDAEFEREKARLLSEI